MLGAQHIACDHAQHTRLRECESHCDARTPRTFHHRLPRNPASTAPLHSNRQVRTIIHAACDSCLPRQRARSAAMLPCAANRLFASDTQRNAAAMHTSRSTTSPNVGTRRERAWRGLGHGGTALALLLRAWRLVNGNALALAHLRRAARVRLVLLLADDLVDVRQDLLKSFFHVGRLQR